MLTNEQQLFNYMLPIRIKLPEHFLDEEVRCEYTISSDMKELWAVEIDLLVELQRVCSKYNIMYWANGGTMLGAVRHKGFIPWDDDVDVMMPRKDYDILCTVADKEFQHPYFFQTEYTDPGSFRAHAQLRNSETTAILAEEIDKNRLFNQGVFLDIFPLDNIPDNKEDFEKQQKDGRMAYREAAIFHTAALDGYKYKKGLSPKNIVKNLIKFCLNAIGSNLAEHIAQHYYKKYEQILARYDEVDTKELAILCLNFNAIEFYLRSDLKKSCLMDFEFIKLPVPYKYDNVLSGVFGNWHKFVKGTSLHGSMYVNTERSYKDVVSDIKAGKIDITPYLK